MEKQPAHKGISMKCCSTAYCIVFGLLISFSPSLALAIESNSEIETFSCDKALQTWKQGEGETKQAACEDALSGGIASLDRRCNSERYWVPGAIRGFFESFPSEPVRIERIQVLGFVGSDVDLIPGFSCTITINCVYCVPR